MSRSAIAKWETDNGTPDIANLKMISQMFKIRIDDLLNDDLNNDLNNDLSTHLSSAKKEENTTFVSEDGSTVNSNNQKESKFFKMMKNVLGFEEVAIEEEEDEASLEGKTLENGKDADYNKFADNTKFSQSNMISEDNEPLEDGEKLYRKTEEAYNTEATNENETLTSSTTETTAIDDEKEHTSTLDIFEKFKKLKKEEDEKAERYRRIQKMKQLEELKKQESKLDNNVTEEYSAEDGIDYYDEDQPVVVRTVGTSDSEDARKELNRLEELRKLRNFEIEKQQYRKAYEEKIEPNETFENEDTMDEPHFDFMDRFKRK